MLSTSITWERTPHPVRRPGFSCHLFLDNGKLHVENTSTSELEILMSQLQSPHSPKRRSAAKKLRKLGDPVAGPALLEALKHELPDPRTWETQYQMIMALDVTVRRERRWTPADATPLPSSLRPIPARRDLR
jgi:hypothetical protein